MNNDNLKKLISDKPSNWREKFLQRIKEVQEGFEKKLPPKEIREWMRKKTNDTFDINKGNLDKQSFMLGMMCMWNYLHSKKMISEPDVQECDATEVQ